MSKAVQFGAGNIGRGFLAQLFHESGLEVVFVDVVPSVVEALNARRSYPIYIVGENPETVPITNVRAVSGKEVDAVAAEIAGAEIVATAVGANALPYLGPALAAGLQKRFQNGGSPVNVLLCENLHDAPSVLRNAVAEHLPSDIRDDVLSRTGFVQAVVSRMVPLQTDEDRTADLLAVRVEAYKRLPVDSAAVVGTLPTIAGIEPVANFAAYVARKLYTHNCAHAVLGYIGHRYGHTYGYEALDDPKVMAVLNPVLAETGTALISRFGFSEAEHDAHVADLLRRFRNKSLGDTCIRLARDPIRKLAPDDRLVGAARLCESQHIPPSALSEVIATALTYDVPDDPSAPRLQELLRTQGFDATQFQVCGITADEPLSLLIRAAYDNISPQT